MADEKNVKTAAAKAPAKRNQEQPAKMRMLPHRQQNQ